MKKFNILIAFFALIFVLSCSENNKKPVQNLKDTTEKELEAKKLLKDRFAKHTLWKVSSGKSVVYLFGSVHMLKPEYYPLDPSIENAFNESANLVVEMDPGKVNLEKMTQFGRYTDGSKMSSHIDKKTYKKLALQFKKNGLNIEDFELYKPEFAFFTLIALEITRNGFDPSLGADMHFLKNKGDKNVLELESFESQMSLIGAAMNKYLDRFIDYTFDDLENTIKKLDSLLLAWQMGDIETLERLTFEDLQKEPDYKPFYDMFIFKRNEKMAEKIEGYLETGSKYFVVAGAGHFLGGKGIVSLLEKTGKYKIEQL